MATINLLGLYINIAIRLQQEKHRGWLKCIQAIEYISLLTSWKRNEEFNEFI